MTLETRFSQNLSCDNPKCDVKLTWLEGDQDVDAAPDAFWRFLILAIPGGSEKWTFCSKYCLLEFMKTFETRKSPREIRAENEEKMRQAAEIERMSNEGGHDLPSGGS
jgi:hypothetical protein